MIRKRFIRFSFAQSCLALIAIQALLTSAGSSGDALVAPSAAAVSPAVVLASFEQVFGVTEGRRRNHTKGFCFEGKLKPLGIRAQRYSMSSLFSAESRVIGRLSHKGGNPLTPDDKVGQYGMGLSITTASGERQLMSMNTLDFFPVATPEAFAALMRAKALGGAAVKAFKQSNKDLQRFKAHMAKKPKTLTPYEGSTFNSVNSFFLVNTQGVKTPVRWSFVPSSMQGLVVTPKAEFFFENMQKNLKKGGVSWEMVATFANPEDDINNPAQPWDSSHKQLSLATLEVASISTEQEGRCADINYDPTVLAPGFEVSDDPLLTARRDVYAVSFGKRLAEKHRKH